MCVAPQGAKKKLSRLAVSLLPPSVRAVYRRRYFKFTTSDGMLRYYSNHIDLVEKGVVDLNDIRSVNVVDELTDPKSPTHYHVNIQTSNRKWHFCVDNGTEQTMWNAVFQYVRERSENISFTKREPCFPPFKLSRLKYADQNTPPHCSHAAPLLSPSSSFVHTCV